MKNALIIGIGEIPNAILDYPFNDAYEMNELLSSEKFGFKTDVLYDKDATKAAIFQKIREIKNSDPSMFLVYFSGHGNIIDGMPYLLTCDGTDSDPGIWIDELIKKAGASIDGKDVIIILDSCNSGAAKILEHDNIPISFEMLKQSAALPGSRAIFAACEASGSAFEDKSIGHGRFTQAIINGFTGGAVDFDGNITVSSLHSYLSKVFVDSRKQHPVTRLDLSNNPIIASGFVPKELPLDDSEARAVIFERIKGYTGDIIAEFQKYSTVDDKILGHRSLSHHLESAITWLEATEKQYPDIKGDIEFSKHRRELINRLAELSKLHVGVETDEGQVIEIIGQGAFGTVYKVGPGNGIEYAYKVYHGNDLDDSDKRSRFKRGWNAMRTLKHPNIVFVKSMTTCPVGFFMEYINGPNLRDGLYNFEDIVSRLELIRHISQTIRYSHGQGIIHRDIKPENILCKHNEELQKWQPVLTDFDLSWMSNVTQLTHLGMGTPVYAAPEQFIRFHSKQTKDPRVDIFSIGKLMYFVLTGSDPDITETFYENPRLKECLAEIGNAGLFLDIKNLMSRCCKNHQSARLANIEEIENILDSIILSMREMQDGDNIPDNLFINEILSGLNIYRDSNEGNMVTSTSTRTQVEINVNKITTTDRINLAIYFKGIHSYGQEGTPYPEMWAMLYDRVKVAFQHNGNVKVTKPSGRFLLEISNIERTKAGLTETLEKARRTLDIMERI